MNIKKIIVSLFLFLSILSFEVLDVEADNIDVLRESSLEVIYQYDEEKLSNVDISLYFLASVDQQGSYHFIDNYKDIAFNPIDMSVSDLNLKSEEVEKYIAENERQPSSVQKTNQNGVTNFSGLVPGLYLVSVDSKVVGSYRYDASPMLLSIPTLEDGSYQYDIQMNVKTEREQLEQTVTPPGDEGIIFVPNTIDNIVFYIILLIISFLVILGVISYIFKKKGEKKYENKE